MQFIVYKRLIGIVAELDFYGRLIFVVHDFCVRVVDDVLPLRFRLIRVLH